MAEGLHRGSAAEIPVTSNGDLDQSPDTVFHRDSYSSRPAPPPTSFASPVEGIVESGSYKGSASLPSSPVSPVSPSSAVASRLARSSSDSQAEEGTQPNSGPVVLSDDLKNPAMEKLDLVRKWSINTYKCTRQILSEKLGRGSRTVDLELEAQIELLRDNKRKYQNVIKLTQTLANQLSQIIQTQRQLGDAFADLSLKSPELHEEFGYNADTQKLLSKNGETLLGAMNFFISSVNTLVDKTIEDTMINIKQYETARVEYDAYRTDLEELNLGPRDANTMPKIEQSRLVEKELVEQLQRQLTTAEEALAAKQSKIDMMTQEMLLKEKDLETISVFQAQAEVYSSDFYAERAAREKLHEEKERLAAQLEYVKKMNTQLQDEVDSLGRRSLNELQQRHVIPGGNPHGAGASLVGRSTDWQQQGNIPEHACPKCNEILPDLDSLQIHIMDCIN